ncbi:hypothetical protein RhiirA4_467111 [Rhizophagus irregularis]|uniref:HECT domain-containing protein n=1 Tax=Rhizophagus irregularis TaxID=588596 RepID=A0A2I1GVC4_9GLOM|nr:hypothetical protein RhiirA4_467111 [Rhizophagus irregularis]
MEFLESLPRKCFACDICQKFTPSLFQTQKCAICEHADEVHEQYAELRAQIFLQTHNSSERINYQGKSFSNEPKKDVDLTSEIAQSLSIRDRLKGLSSVDTDGFKQTLKEVIMVPYIVNNKTIYKGSEMWNKLLDKNLIKLNITFYNGSIEGVQQKMTDEFPIIRECGWRFLRPKSQNSTELIPYEEQKPKSGQVLRDAITVRKRLYIGPTIRNVIEPPRSIVNSSSLNRSISNFHEDFRPIDNRIDIVNANSFNSRSNYTSIVNSSSLERPISNVHEILRPDNQIEINLNENSRLALNFRKDLLKLLRSKYNINEYDNISIRFESLESSAELLLHWIMDASTEDLLKNPMIIISNNDVIDTGGVFRNVTELFWDDVKKREFNGGKLFDGDKAFLIQQNASIVEWAYPKIMGKALFWSLIHAGTWPKWLDQMHLQYIIEGENTIMCLNVLNKHIPYLYNLAHDLLINPESRNSRKNDIEYWIQHCGLDFNEMLLYNNDNLANYIAKFEIIIKRKKSLEMMKDGFDVASCLRELREFGWNRLEKILYLKLNSNIFLSQLDEFQIEMTINEIPSLRLERKQIFDWFKNWIYIQNFEMLEKLLIFITGSTYVPLERKITIQWRKNSENKLLFASTCSCNLILCHNYNSISEFHDYIELCINCAEGFSESGYQRIGQTVINGINQEVNNESLVSIAEESRSIYGTQTELSEGFSESGYQRIGQTVINGINQEVNNESLVSIAEESRSIYGTQTELSDLTIVKEEFEVIDLTIDDTAEKDDENDLALENHVKIDIREEAYSIDDRKKSRRKSKKKPGKKTGKKSNYKSNYNEEMKIVEHHFVEVTAEDIVNDGSKKNKDKRKPTRSPIETRSKTSATTRSNHKDN